jgi:GTP cyclohydrolase II
MGRPKKIVSLDPFGHTVAQDFGRLIGEGIDIRPSIAITKARLNLPEILAAMGAHRLAADGHILHASGDISVTKIAVDPVWYLPGIAERFGDRERAAPHALRADRRHVSRTGDAAGPQGLPAADRLDHRLCHGRGLAARRSEARIACRVHDECNGSDVFGSDICTCRPYLTHGIEECVKEAQSGGVGLIVYNRKEGGRSARSRSSSSTTPASARRAAIPPRPISSAPNASPACRTPASSSSCRMCCTGSARHADRPADVDVEHEIRRHGRERHRHRRARRDPARAGPA